MSVERLEREEGVVWRVRWREGGCNRSQVLGRKRDAEAFDAELKRRRRTGEIAHLDAGKETLAQFGEDWWRLYAEPNLAATTLQVYAAMWDAYVLPHLGARSLRELTPTVVHGFRLELEAAGRRAWLPRRLGAWLDELRQPPEGPPLVRLVAGYDPYLLGYRRRDLAVPPRHARRIHPGGGLLHPALLVDGLALGTWRSKRRGTRVEVAVEPFGALAANVDRVIDDEVEDLGRFLGLAATRRPAA